MKTKTGETLERIEKSIARCKQRYACTTGDASGYCDGTKVGSRMRCPYLIRTGQEQNACELAL